MVCRIRSYAKVLVLTAPFYPQVAAADGFTGSTLLAWPQAQQDSFFQTSVTMLGFVAAETGDHSEIARCVDSWYWKDGRADPERNDLIREAVQRFPDYHPQMTILAVVEKACGKFNPS